MTNFMLLPMVSFPTHREEKRNLVSDTQFHSDKLNVGLALGVGVGWVDQRLKKIFLNSLKIKKIQHFESQGTFYKIAKNA
jgi:hypothetical protein